MEDIREVVEQGRMIVGYDEKADLNLSENQKEQAIEILRQWALVAEIDSGKAYGIWEGAEGENTFEAMILRQAIRFRLQKEDDLDDGFVIATILGIKKPVDVSFRSLLDCFDDKRYSFDIAEVSFQDPFELFLWEVTTSFFSQRPEWFFLLLWIFEERPMVVTDALRSLVGSCPFLSIRNDQLIFLPEVFFAEVDLESLHFSEGNFEVYSEAFFRDVVRGFVLDNGSLAVQVQESKPFLALHWGKGSK